MFFSLFLFAFCLRRCQSDPLVSHGRHFGRTVHALCNMQALLTNRLLRLGERAEEPEELFTEELADFCTCLLIQCQLTIDSIYRERREHRVFGVLLQMVPGLETRLMEGSEDDLVSIAEMVCS